MDKIWLKSPEITQKHNSWQNHPSMKVHLPNSAFWGNINAFLKKIDLSDLDTLK